MKVGARSVDHAALPILLEGDLDGTGAQMVERRRVIHNGKRMMYAAVVLRRAIDRRLALDQDQAGTGGIEKGHRATRDGRQMPAADDVGVKAGAASDIADRNAEMDDGFECDHRPSLAAVLPSGDYHVGHNKRSAVRRTWWRNKTGGLRFAH